MSSGSLPTVLGLVLALSACPSATGVHSPAAPNRLIAVSPGDQVGAEHTAVNFPPEVRVLGPDGRGLAGVAVTFTVDGGSAVEPAATVTDGNGFARVSRWTLATDPAVLRAAMAEVEPLVFRAEARPRGFQLEVRWLVPPTAEADAAVALAASILETVIYGDLPDEVVEDTPACLLPGVGPVATINEVIDDTIILAMIGPIDGPGGAGAQGFPCLIRDPGTQTLVGFIRFDTDDFGALTTELRRAFALHEMIHALGLVPQLLNVTTPTGFSRHCLALPSAGLPNLLVQDTHFPCANAVAAFDRVGGTRYAGAKVPLENGATRPLGPNTLNHHWRKSSLRHELMTGWFILGVPAALSIVTAGALADLGYAVSYAGAEPFLLEGEITPAPGSPTGFDVPLREPAEIPPASFVRSPRP